MKVVKVGSALWCRPIVPYGVGPHGPMVPAQSSYNKSSKS